MLEYIKSDLYRYYGKCNLKTFIYGYIKNKCFRFTTYLRMCNGKGIIKYIGLFFWILNRNKSIQIHYKTKIGYGFYIGHYAPIFINKNVIIGNNCNISQCCTIGSNIDKAALIGDNVYIGPNVCIIDDVKIGNNVTIGAGSIVTKDIPDNATAVGNYAKVINYNNPKKFIKNPWIKK